ncbi:MAG: hypothetical protein ACREHD_32375, partial [Pirellulales bacterium]
AFAPEPPGEKKNVSADDPDVQRLTDLIERKRAAAAEQTASSGVSRAPACAPDTCKIKGVQRAPNTKHPRKHATEKTLAHQSVQCQSATNDLALTRAGNVGSAVAEIVTAATDPEHQATRSAQIDRLMAELIRQGGVAADGGRLDPRAARKIAQAVLDGWIDWTDDVLRLLDVGASKALHDPPETPAPWVYLVGTMPKIFAERERCWNTNARPPPAKPKAT